MTKEYKTATSQFFFIRGISINVIQKIWQKFTISDSGILCLDNLNDHLDDKNSACIIIGGKHSNGDGLHCQVTFDGTKGCISFESDIAGAVPVFWLVNGKTIIVASSIKLLISLAKDLEIELKPNLSAFSEFLIASYIYSEMQTGVQNVQMLPPKSQLIINSNSGSVNIKKTGSDFTYSQQTLSWPKAKEMFSDALVSGLQRYRGRKAACLLSGGADSRIVAVSAVKSGIDVDFFTFGQSTVNISDFYVANQVAYRLNKKTKCFSTSAEAFIKNWEKSCANANWINDSVWWAGRIPQEMFQELQKYDVILRGDGDGIYGWKTAVANVNDILHMLEISQIQATKKFSKYFQNADAVFTPAQVNRNHLIDKYNNSKHGLRELTNILYQKIREPRGVMPGVWHFSPFTLVDCPLLWEQPLAVAAKIPKNKRFNKQIIFDVLKTCKEIKNVPFSTGASWDNQLEFYYTGVLDQLVDYIERHSPWTVFRDRICADFLVPPSINKSTSSGKRLYGKTKKLLLGTPWGRKAAFRYFPHLAGTSLSERLVVRLAIISNLCDVLTKKNSERNLSVLRDRTALH